MNFKFDSIVDCLEVEAPVEPRLKSGVEKRGTVPVEEVSCVELSDVILSGTDFRGEDVTWNELIIGHYLSRWRSIFIRVT